MYIIKHVCELMFLYNVHVYNIACLWTNVFIQCIWYSMSGTNVLYNVYRSNTSCLWTNLMFLYNVYDIACLWTNVFHTMYIIQHVCELMVFIQCI